MTEKQDEIWIADIVVGTVFAKVIKNQPVKKLPLAILLADNSFIKRVKQIVNNETTWKSHILKNKTVPKITIIYHRKLSDSNEDFKKQWHN